MKKLIYGALFLAVVGITVIACKKAIETPIKDNQITSSESVNSESQKMNVSDKELIGKINNLEKSSLNLSELEDLLMDNTSLDDSVLNALINNSQIPDDMVELMAILSSPLSNQIISGIRNRRSKIDMTTINAVQTISSTIGFTVQNTNPRTVLFGNNMVFSKNDSCDCENIACDTEGCKLVKLTTSFTDPSRMIGCKEEKWICGTSKAVFSEGENGTYASFTVTCVPSSNKCIRIPRSQRQ